MTFLDGHDAVGKEFEAETQDLEGIEEVGALKILKRGLNASPELKAGVSLTALAEQLITAWLKQQKMF